MRRPPVFRIPVVQTMVLLVLAAITSLYDQDHALAMFIGGMIAILPHGYFTLFAYRYMGARSAPEIAQAFKKGETGKFVLTLVGFATAFAVLPVAKTEALWVFAGYAQALVLQIYLVGRAVRNE